MSAKDNTSNQHSLGERIKFYRRRLEMSQMQLEIEVGLGSGSM